MTTEQIKLKLIQLHRQENEMNKLISGYDKQIKNAENKKKKTAKMISSNMKYRNILINNL
jgi:hypothetical protein